MDLPDPALDELRRLYEAAITLKQEAPWEWMYEDEIFGVRNPETGEIGYVSIMGNLGEHLALGLYLGPEAPYSFWQLSQGEGTENPDLFLEARRLEASFEDRDTLHAKDREIIKALGLKFRGQQAWPMFRSYIAGYAPWFVTPEEARFLLVAIEQALEVAARLHSDPELLEPPDGDQYLVRVHTEQGWADEWLTPPPPPEHTPPAPDTGRLAAMRRNLPRQKWILQVDLFLMGMVVREKDHPRPYLPYLLLVVEAGSGMILGTELLVAEPSLDTMWGKAQAAFLKILTRLQGVPYRIDVHNKRLHSLMEPIAAGLGVQLQISRRLPALDAARHEMEMRL
jgi:Domain of unknown function (DUF6930)